MATTTYLACPQCAGVNRLKLDAARTRAPVCGKCHSTLDYHAGATEVSGAQLAALIRSSPVPVVVDFWAEWCGPCRSFAPTFEQTARRREGDAVFVKLDTERHPDAARAHAVRGIPTIAVFRDGAERGRKSGALPAAKQEGRQVRRAPSEEVRLRGDPDDRGQRRRAVRHAASHPCFD